MVHDADGADDFANNSGLAEGRHVGRVTDDERGTGRFLTASHTYSASTLEKNFVDIRVQHVGAAVDSAKTTEGLG